MKERRRCHFHWFILAYDNSRRIMFSLDRSAGVLGDRYWRIFSIWASNTAVTRYLSYFRDMGIDELLLSSHLTPYNPVWLGISSCSHQKLQIEYLEPRSRFLLWLLLFVLPRCDHCVCRNLNIWPLVFTFKDDVVSYFKYTKGIFPSLLVVNIYYFTATWDSGYAFSSHCTGAPN